VLVEVEKRGTKIKKTLAIDPVDSETVQLIFKLYLYGDGTSGALGAKEIVKWLNSRGYLTCKGKTFGTGTVYKILTNTTYSAVYEWRLCK
jgi:site-specific DNA recombinase